MSWKWKDRRRGRDRRRAVRREVTQEGLESIRCTTCAIIGLGYWGPNLLRVLSEIDDADVKWICDLDRAQLSRYGRQYADTCVTTSIDEVLDDPEVDAVFIATPVYTHFELAAQCLGAQKHTFVEKPLALSSKEADELIDLARAEGVKLMCGHTFLYSPPVQKIRELMEQGDLGTIYFISSSRVNLGLHQRDVSVVWDLGPHDFSILLYWLGEVPQTVRAVGRDSIVEGIHDVAFVTLQFRSGVVANVELSWLAPSKLRRTVLVGSEQMVVYEDSGSEPVRIYDHGVIYEYPESFGEYQLSYRTGDIRSPKVESAEPLMMQLSDFISAVSNESRLSSHLRLARDVVRITEAANHSLQEGGTAIPVDTAPTLVGGAHQ